MQLKQHSLNGTYKFPQTHHFSLLSQNLIICIRAWSGDEALQKIVEEVERYLSSAEVEIEVTTPFDYLESLSPIANKIRVSLLLANEALYTINKELYTCGHEVIICYKHKNEIGIGSIGRFSVTAHKEQKKLKLYETGGLCDDQILLPANLVGLDREPEIRCASTARKNLKVLELHSAFDESTFWTARITDF